MRTVKIAYAHRYRMRIRPFRASTVVDMCDRLPQLIISHPVRCSRRATPPNGVARHLINYIVRSYNVSKSYHYSGRFDAAVCAIEARRRAALTGIKGIPIGGADNATLMHNCICSTQISRNIAKDSLAIRRFSLIRILPNPLPRAAYASI
jgi:hypothetical protein